jgi:hypothetical protein
MCGPTQAQTDLQESQAQFYSTLQQQDKQQYGEDQQILQQMQSVYQPILQQGADQYGYTEPEDQTLNTEAMEGVGTNYKSASTALREEQAAEGGGNDYLPSGVKRQQQEQVSTGAAGTLSQEQLQIKQAGFQHGYDKFTQATNALEGTAGLLNPNGAASVANTAGADEGTTASQIAQENESWMAPLAGAVGAIGGAATGAEIMHCWVAAELWGGWDDPRVAKVRTWIFGEFSRTRPGAAVARIYARHGERTAAAIRRWPILRRVFLPLFNLALRKAGE